MRVGVVEPVAEDHVEEHPRPAPGQLVRVAAGAPRVVELGERGAVQVLHRQHPARGELRDRGRELHARVAGEVLGGRFAGAAVRGGSRVRATAPAGTRRPPRPAGTAASRGGTPRRAAASSARMARSVCTRRAMSGCWTLTDHLPAVGQGGPVRLADRRRRERRLVEPGEHLLERPLQLGLDGRAGRPRTGRPGRCDWSLRQLVGQCRADEVAAGAEHLAELDERGAEFGEREPDAGLAGTAR